MSGDMLGFPSDPPRNARCVYYECPGPADVLVYVMSGDADHMSATWNGLCGRHVQAVCDKWIQEMKGHGPCKSLVLILP